MKKFLTLLLAMVMMLGLVACGGTNSNAGNTGNNSQQTDNTGNTGDEGGDSTDSPDIKIGVILIHDENSGYDVAHIDGITQACENLGIDMANVSFKYNIAEDSNCYDAAADLADSGCDIIFSDSYGHQAFMLQAAQDFPDITFVACTGDQAGVAGQDNLKNIFPYTYESRYVSGVVAGMKLKELLDSGAITEPKVGYVGAYPYAEVVSGYTAFFLGIQSIVPEATMEVQYTNSWYDQAKEAETANALMANGCVIIGQHADSTGAPSAVQAEHDKGKEVYSVGYNIDMLSVAPDAALTSSQNVWYVLYQDILEKFLAGEEIPSDFACGYAEGAQTISPLGPACAEGTQEAVDAAWAGLKDGTLNIFDTSKFTVDGKTIDSYEVNFSIIDFTTGDVVFEGPTVDVIENGVFQESVHRAAPYFDLRIDGITELN